MIGFLCQLSLRCGSRQKEKTKKICFFAISYRYQIRRILSHQQAAMILLMPGYKVPGVV
jgi:hypothetical protein